MSEEAANSLGVEFIKAALTGGGPGGIVGAAIWSESEKKCAGPQSPFGGRQLCLTQTVDVLGVTFHSMEALIGVTALLGLALVGLYLLWFNHLRE